MREANWNLFSRETRLCFDRIKESLELHAWSSNGEVVEMAKVTIKCALEEGLDINEFKEIVQNMLNLFAQVVTHAPSTIKSFEEELNPTQPLAKIEAEKPPLSYPIPERSSNQLSAKAESFLRAKI